MELNPLILACPGLDNPTCGIGNYTREFAAVAKALCPSVVVTGRPLIELVDLIARTAPATVHIQFEYGWASPQRLEIIRRECARRRSALVVTLHSYKYGAEHHDPLRLRRAGAHTVVHSPSQLTELPFAHCIPLAVPYVEPASDAITTPRARGVARIGWFGNVFFHKGLHQLIHDAKLTCAAHPVELLILGGEPPHSKSYYQRCREMVEEARATHPGLRVLWYNGWLPDAHVVAHLKTCDQIVFPYDEYGATGCSAALRLAWNAERPCVVPPGVSHFEDVVHAHNPRMRAPVVLKSRGASLSLVDPQHFRRVVRNANNLRRRWSFHAIVTRHINEIYCPAQRALSLDHP